MLRSSSWSSEYISSARSKSFSAVEDGDADVAALVQQRR